jgi:Domain of unknown function (DUF4402)
MSSRLSTNSATYNVHIDADGTYANSPALVLVGASPQRGEYEITGLAPNTLVSSIDVVQLDELLGPGAEGFFMDNFEVNYPFGTTTDGSGDIIIYLGARANTNASGGAYADGSYTGQLELTFNL